MNRKACVCLKDLLNQNPPCRSKLELNSRILKAIPEESYSHEMQQIKKKNQSRLLSSDFSNSLNKIEFTLQGKGQKNETKKYHSFKDAVKKVHEEFIQSYFKLHSHEKQVVPEFIRQRDLQKKEMKKLILEKNSQCGESLKNKCKYEVIVIEIILLSSIIYMWLQIIVHFSNK